MIGFTVACKRFFGLKTGPDLKGFSAEVHQLTETDRAEMAPLIGAELKEEVSADFVLPNAKNAAVSLG